MFFFSSRRRHTRCLSDWSSDVCSSDLVAEGALQLQGFGGAGAGGCAEIGKAESGNRNTEGAAVSACFLLSPSSYFLRPCFITPLVFALRFALSALRFQLFASCPGVGIELGCGRPLLGSFGLPGVNPRPPPPCGLARAREATHSLTP